MIEQSEAKTKLANAIKQQLINCIGYQGDELQSHREEAYKYYFQRPRGDEIQGRSTIVTGDLSSMVEGNLAQMTEPLTNRRIAEFCAYDEADEEQAQLESDCVNELIFKRQNGFIEITSAIKSAMLLRNCVTKVYVDVRNYKKNVRKSNVNPAIINDLLDSIKKQQSARGTEVAVDVHLYDQRNKTFSATVHKTTKTFRVEAVAPENLLVLKTWDKHDLEGIPFVAERHVEPRSTLRERGFRAELVNALPKYANGMNELTQNVRVPGGLSRDFKPAIDQSQENVEWFECYVQADAGDGTSELRRICTGPANAAIVLEDEPADIICYAVGVIFINPHSFVGISLHDKLKSTQDSTVALTRALMDNLNGTNKNRTAHLDGVVEETDLTDGRTNGSIRVNPSVGITDVRQAITAFSIPDTSANILQNLEHMRRVRSEMGGATLDMATGQMQLNDRLGSQGLDRAYSVMEMLASFMTKVIANTLIRNMFLIAHETLRTQWDGPISFKRGNQWVEQIPAKWQARQAVTVNLGKSMGERARESAVLEKLMDRQAALAAAGMEDILVDVVSYYKAFMSWLRVNDVANPEQYAIDPRSPRAIKAMNARAVQRAQQQKKQDSLLQQAVGLEQVRVGLDKYKTDAELQYKYWDTAIGAQIEEAKLALKGIIDYAAAIKTAQTQGKDNDTGRESSSSKSAASKSVATSDTD